MNEIHLIKHPLIQHKLTMLRDHRTGAKIFRELISEVASLLVYEVTRDLPLQEITIKTPLMEAQSPVLSGKKLAIIPVLRAGLGMVEGILKLIPAARVGHVGLYRDPETLEPVEYYCKLPMDIAERDSILLDPMLATGGSASAGISALKKRGVYHIKLVSIVSAPEGIEKVHGDHGDVAIYTGAIDDGLNDHGYIVPGLGDAGDRLYGTK